jgi:hypothetical protein
MGLKLGEGDLPSASLPFLLNTIADLPLMLFA